jgi:hypothetical protein
MRYRISAVQDAGLPEGWGNARQWLEEWLNTALGDVDFRCRDCCVMIVVFATSFSKNPAISRLIDGNTNTPTLALHVVVEPEQIEGTDSSEHLQLLCKEVSKQLPAKPLRKPKELDYERLRSAILSCVEPFTSAAA